MRVKCEKCINCKLINEFGQVKCDYLSKVEPNRVVDKPKYCPNFKSIKGARK